MHTTDFRKASRAGTAKSWERARKLAHNSTAGIQTCRSWLSKYDNDTNLAELDNYNTEGRRKPPRRIMNDFHNRTIKQSGTSSSTMSQILNRLEKTTSSQSKSQIVASAWDRARKLSTLSNRPLADCRSFLSGCDSEAKELLNGKMDKRDPKVRALLNLRHEGGLQPRAGAPNVQSRIPATVLSELQTIQKTHNLDLGQLAQCLGLLAVLTGDDTDFAAEITNGQTLPILS